MTFSYKYMLQLGNYNEGLNFINIHGEDFSFLNYGNMQDGEISTEVSVIYIFRLCYDPP